MKSVAQILKELEAEAELIFQQQETERIAKREAVLAARKIRERESAKNRQAALRERRRLAKLARPPKLRKRRKRRKRKLKKWQKPLLTRRQKEVLGLVACDLSNRQIANWLGRTIKTVASTRYNAMKRLGLTSGIQITKWIIKHGYLKL